MQNLPETLGIRHIALRVRDLRKTEDFYVKILGYRVEWRPDADNVYLCRDRDNLALHRVENVNGPGALDHFGILLRRPADVDAWAAHIESSGIRIKVRPKTHRDGARSFYADDPEGNTIQFIYHPPISDTEDDGR